MRIAIPVAEGKLAMHFGHCQSFAILDCDNGLITGETSMIPPPHEPGVLPKWIGEEVKADLIIAGGMGTRAQELFIGHGVKVLVGAQVKAPKELVEDYFAGNLPSGVNACDH